MHALIIDGTIDRTTERLPASARRLDTRQWVLGLPDADQATRAACGWHPVTETPAPTAAANEVVESSVVVVAGLPVRTWTVRAKTAVELADAVAVTVRAALDARMRQALADNKAYLAIAAPTNAQNTAQTKRLTRQVNALVRHALSVLDTDADT